MGRPPIFDRPMTPTERTRRYRTRKRAGATDRPQMTVKQLAAYVGRSERWLAYQAAYQRDRAFPWDAAVIDGKHGRVGMTFIAEVCRLGTEAAQRQVHDAIKAEGAAAGRALWWRMKAAGL